ncbi:hypothetical protein LTR17_025491 [Elasticomyces elasticus]|nr:hypothetical protein LTR17_025491 [Elasticomyces elasticus]
MAQSKPPSALQRFARANFTSSFLYPLKGIYYFATHRYIQPLLRSRLLPLTLLSTCILAILFLTAYLPVVAFLALFHYSGSAWVNGTFFILGVGTLLTSMLFEALFVDGTQVDIFDAVMVAEGYEHLVKTRRPVADDIEESDPVKRIGPREKGATFAPFSLRQIVELIILLPLNFVPFAGVPLFLLLTGYRAGPFLNWRYFQLKGFDKRRRNQYIKTKKRRFEYLWFGTVYMVLQLIPVLSMLLLLTSAAGSALWSVHVERELALMEEERPAGEYSDDVMDAISVTVSKVGRTLQVSPWVLNSGAKDYNG